MEPFVIKRNGEYKLFEEFKIKDAIQKAFESVCVKYNDDIFEKVKLSIGFVTVISVEEIQDIIEKVLYESSYFDVMKSFMLYRHTRKMQREHDHGLNEDTTYIDSTHTVEEYINKSDWRINANANTSYSNAGLVNNISGKVIANFWLDKIYSKEEGFAHRNGDIHIHDLDCLTGYCAGWSLRVLLNEGFNGKPSTQSL